MSKPLGIAALLFPFSGFLFAQAIPPDAEWQKVRAHQPPALHLKMTLAKDHFFQGEKIDATVEFFNEDTQPPYSLVVGAGEPGAKFHGWDAQGHDLVNPLQWRDDWLPISVEGPVGTYPIGRYTLIRPVNENIRFDQPGVCAIYALAWVNKSSDAFKNPNGNRVELVSDPVTVTITPLSAEQEAQAIAAARQKIGITDENYPFGWDTGVEELNYLQTPAARAELISLLGDKKLCLEAGWGLLSAPDPPGEAARILAAVQAGKLTLDDNGVDLYAELKLSRIYIGRRPDDFTEKQAEDIVAPRLKILEEARQEITAALLKSSGDEGPVHVEALWTAFQDQAIHRNPGDPDKDGGRARAAMAAHQLELPPDDVKRLLDAWAYWGSADFLPLIRREADPPANNLVALIALAGLQPDEARPQIIKEFQQPNPRFFEGHYPASTLLPTTPAMPLPQFDLLFKKQLAEEKGNAFPIIPVIGCFGSPALLPDVVKAHDDYGADVVQGNSYREPWDTAIKECFFRYWLRCDPQGAAIGLEQEIQSDAKHDNGFSLIFLRHPWTDSILPVAEWELASSNRKLVSEGVSSLAEHGNESVIDPILTALERLRSSNEDIQVSSYFAVSLLKSTRWHYSDEQKKRLEVLASTPQSR